MRKFIHEHGRGRKSLDSVIDSAGISSAQECIWGFRDLNHVHVPRVGRAAEMYHLSVLGQSKDVDVVSDGGFQYSNEPDMLCIYVNEPDVLYRSGVSRLQPCCRT